MMSEENRDEKKGDVQAAFSDSGTQVVKGRQKKRED